MKFYLVDDMHLEFAGYKMPGDPEGTLLLAGDISVPVVFKEGRTDQKSLKLAPRFREFFEHVSNSYKKVYYIAGNHEFYNGYWEDTRDFMRVATKDTNVTVLEKEWVDLGDDIHLYGATFWTSFRDNDPSVTSVARRGMNDYNLIHTVRDNSLPYARRNGSITPDMVYQDHLEARKTLEEGLAVRRGKKVIVMTHHAPSLNSSHPRFGGTSDPLNWAYCSELDQFIIDNPTIKFWVHGHTHDTHDYMLGSTHVLCNPRGYAYGENALGENYRFKPDLSFEVV
jgi:predicted phosphodiesterase